MKKILITGCCGTIGRALLDKLSKNENNYLICIDHDEGTLFELSNIYKKKILNFYYVISGIKTNLIRSCQK